MTIRFYGTSGDEKRIIASLPSSSFSPRLQAMFKEHFKRMQALSDLRLDKRTLAEVYQTDRLIRTLMANRDYTSLPQIDREEKFTITTPPLFKKFSAEPTYFPLELRKYADQMESNDFIKKSEALIKELIQNTWLDWGERDWVVSHKDPAYNKIFYNCRCYIDAGNLEVLTGIHNTWEEFRENFSHIENYLHKKGFVPSPLVEPEMEGGCHMNFDLAEIVKLGEHFTSKFLYNYQRLMCDNPSAIWIFLPPNDNKSSTIPFYDDLNQYNKGDFFTLRNKDGHSVKNWSDVSYIEMRHFGMPTTEYEFRTHYDFCRAILSYVFKITASNAVISKPSKDLKTYTKEKAINELESFCHLIHFNPDVILDLEKLWRIEKRIEYGPDYLV